MNNLAAVILAAGHGTRMHSSMPKVLHSLCGRPMLDHVLEAVEGAEVNQIYIVTGFKETEVRNFVDKRAICVTQEKRLGTAHAVLQVAQQLQSFKGDILVTCGDTPMVKTETIQRIIKLRRAHHTAATVLTTELENPAGYGRIVRNRDNTIRKIVEDKDTNIYEMAIKEVNTGIYCFDAEHLFPALEKVDNKNAQQEYYLPDVIELLYEADLEVEALVAEDSSELLGVNSRRDLATAERCLRDRILDKVMKEGVTIIDPAVTYIDKQAVIGRDTIVHPFSIISGESVIGENCTIGPNAHIQESRIGRSVEIVQAIIRGADIGDEARIGPYANVLPGAQIAAHQTVQGPDSSSLNLAHGSWGESSVPAAG